MSTIKRLGIPESRIKSVVYNVPEWKHGFTTAIFYYNLNFFHFSSAPTVKSKEKKKPFTAGGTIMTPGSFITTKIRTETRASSEGATLSTVGRGGTSISIIFTLPGYLREIYRSLAPDPGLTPHLRYR